MIYCILSQIEVLGVSLPWSGVFNNEGSGARIAEAAKKSLKETKANPFLSGAESNPFSNTSLTNETVMPSMQNSSSANWLDLLTGEDKISEPVSEPFSHPLAQNNVQEGSDSLDFLDQAVIEYHGAERDNKFSSSHDANNVQKYINCLKTLAGPQMVCCCFFSCVVKLVLGCLLYPCKVVFVVLNIFFLLLHKKRKKNLGSHSDVFKC